jgi:hypothetical protein
VPEPVRVTRPGVFYGERRASGPSRATHRERRESAMVQSYSMNATP